MNSIIVTALVVVAAVAFVLVLRNMGGGDRIPSAEAHELVANGAQLVDVRTPNEFASGHLDGAINIPVADIAARQAQLDKGAPVVVYCRSGARSARAASVLKGDGFDVHDLGPISAW